MGQLQLSANSYAVARIIHALLNKTVGSARFHPGENVLVINRPHRKGLYNLNFVLFAGQIFAATGRIITGLLHFRSSQFCNFENTASTLPPGGTGTISPAARILYPRIYNILLNSNCSNREES